MAKQKKYYVVWKGRIPGIYLTWAEAKDQVDQFEGAVYKSYPSYEEARQAYESNVPQFKKRFPTLSSITAKNNSGSIPIVDSIAVDAACSGNPGLLEYQGVFTKTGQRLFHQGPFKKGTNNVGEFLALVHALAYCKKHNITYPIYSDSVNAIIWVRNKKANTKLKKTPANEPLFDLIERAEHWLNTNTYESTILKWETASWGEIPADFGRK